ncbi:hypothetical protein NQ318_012947 [Aromia moschata]|uniref:Transposase n=1 Tax=Aromia moschata TaxID=1265417 RepID=A0AAV8XRE1_9CUCU|nr:hypothetical protein NQ318_012947 [Aromia moschata]
MRKNAHIKCKLFKSYLKMIQIDGKVTLTLFWDKKGNILEHYMSSHTTVTSATYTHLFKNYLKPAIRTTRRRRRSAGVLLEHDNARPHSAHATMNTIVDQLKILVSSSTISTISNCKKVKFWSRLMYAHCFQVSQSRNYLGDFTLDYLGELLELNGLDDKIIKEYIRLTNANLVGETRVEKSIVVRCFMENVQFFVSTPKGPVPTPVLIICLMLHLMTVVSVFNIDNFKNRIGRV